MVRVDVPIRTSRRIGAHRLPDQSPVITDPPAEPTSIVGACVVGHIRTSPLDRPKYHDMNFLSHGYTYVDRPYFLSGTAVPDWLSHIDRRIRARRKLAVAFVDDVDPHTAAVARGIVQHHDDDQRFHSSRTFVEMSMRFAVELREQLPPDNGMRCGFIGHIVIELLLDAYLHEQRPGLLDRYYQAMAHVRPDVVQAAVNRITGKPTQRLAKLIPKFVDAEFLYDYQTDAGLLLRMNQVLTRIGLELLPEALTPWLSDVRGQVYAQAEPLLAVADASPEMDGTG